MSDCVEKLCKQICEQDCPEFFNTNRAIPVQVSSQVHPVEGHAFADGGAGIHRIPIQA
jgi:hypothetical protein